MTPAEFRELIERMCLAHATAEARRLEDQARDGWARVEKAALGDGACKRTEVLWLNPAASAALGRRRDGQALFA